MYFRKYSTASDIWSFGCLLYEIWSLGRMPFKDYTNVQVHALLAKSAISQFEVIRTFGKLLK